MEPSSTLAELFLDDHRLLTRHLSDILRALRSDDIPTAARLAKELDRLAGPHMQFEEEILYPEVRKYRGSEYVSGLYEEHRVGLEAVRTLTHLREGAPLDSATKETLESHIRTALEHAVSCGSLLSYLNALDPTVQSKLAGQLLAFRKRGRRWTEIDPRK